MPKLKRMNILPAEKQLLAIPDHYVNLPGKITPTELAKLAIQVEDTYGYRQVVPRGTLVHMDGDGVVTAPTADTKANAVLFTTIFADMYDETDSAINAAVLVHGFVRPSRLTGDVDAAELRGIFLTE